MRSRSSSSLNSSSSDGSAKSRSTIKTAKFVGDYFQHDQMDQFNSRMNHSGSMVESTMTQTHMPPMNKDRLMTDVIFLRHPRSILILASIQLCLSIKITVFGLICRFYEGCPYGTAIWVGVLFLFNSILGVVFVKLLPKRNILLIYCTASILCLILTVILFILTAWLLDNEEYMIRKKGWDYIRQRAYELNRIIENTKLAMYALHLILGAAFGVCCCGTVLFLCLNVSAPPSEDLRGYYIANSPFGHQTVLVPVALKTGVDEDTLLFNNWQHTFYNRTPAEPVRLFVSTGTQTVITGRYI